MCVTVSNLIKQGIFFYCCQAHIGKNAHAMFKRILILSEQNVGEQPMYNVLCMQIIICDVRPQNLAKPIANIFATIHS